MSFRTYLILTSFPPPPPLKEGGLQFGGYNFATLVNVFSVDTFSDSSDVYVVVELLSDIELQSLTF